MVYMYKLPAVGGKVNLDDEEEQKAFESFAKSKKPTVYNRVTRHAVYIHVEKKIEGLDKYLEGVA